MKIRVLTLLLVIGFFAVMMQDASAQNAVGIKVLVAKKSYKPGQTGTLLIKFKHGPKVKIPKEPPIEVTVSGDGITGIGVQDYTGGDGDYIESSHIKYDFKIGNNVESGSPITITGTVRFGYCSTETGTCKIATKSFTVTVNIK